MELYNEKKAQAAAHSRHMKIFLLVLVRSSL
jgi:hypothetical protein